MRPLAPAPAAGRPVRAWPLRRRFTVAVAVAAVVVAALGTVVSTTFEHVKTVQSHVTRTYYSAVRASSSLFTAYLDEETGIRGYLLTQDPRFLEPWTAGRAQEQAAAAELRRLLGHEPDLAVRLAALQAQVSRWQSSYAQPAVDQVRAGRAAAVTPALQEDGKRLFDRVRSGYAAYETALLAARAAAVDDLGHGQDVLAVAFTILAAFVLLALTGLGVGLRRWVIDPLDAVRSDVGAVADGDLDHPVRRRGPPELGQVADDVERMRARLLRAYREQLDAARTLAEQREQLVHRADDLRRSNAELEQFAYVASHDLQEPLRKVASFTELLQRRYAGRLDERADTYIEFAVDGAHRMQGLINALLAFSRVGRVGVTRVPVDLRGVLDRARADLAAVIDESGATIEIDGPDGAGPAVVTGDPGLLAQVFQNLIGNALKFHRPGVAPAIRVAFRRAGDDWRVDVADDGLGIDAEYADRIFVIFSRLNRREDYPGTGIGLALCKKIVEYHGGRIWLGEPAGSGTTMSLTLPIAAGPAPGGTE